MTDLSDLIGEEQEIEIVSAMDHPDLANSMSAAALSSVNEQPQMEDEPLGQVELPGGWIAPDGSLQTKAIVTELTGRAEEKLARIDPMSNMPLFLQTMVQSALESIGGHEPTPEMLRDLLIGDREMLILGIRSATYGNEVQMHIVCPQCGAEEDIGVELDKDIPVKKMETPSVREYDVELRRGSVAKVVPATAGLQDEIWDIKKSAAEMKTATLGWCVKSIDGAAVNHQTVLDLGMGDRKIILDFLADLQPGPDYEGVRLPCEACGQEFALVLDLADLFR